MRNNKIRAYNPNDRRAIKEICADTGLLGKPIDPVFSDREIFSDPAVGYYLSKEPNHAFVVEINREVVRYLIGSTKRYAYLGIALNGIKLILKAIGRLLSGKYRNHPQNKQYLKWFFTRAAFEVPKHPPNSAHLHFNIKEGYRNYGIGAQLLENFYKNMRREGIRQLFESVYAHSAKPEKYFQDIGFKIYDKKRSTIFKNHIKGEVYLLCVTKYID